MTQLEGIIRPFETGNISPAKPLPLGEGEQPPANTVIEVKGTAPKTFAGQFSVDITYYHVKKPKEKKRDDTLSPGANPSGPPPVAGNELPPAGYP